MILLSNASLDYAYQICKERNNFYVVVACSSEQEKIGEGDGNGMECLVS